MPLHRLVLFACGFIGAISIKTQTHLSVLETLAQSKVMTFASLTSGPLASATVGDLLFGAGTICAGWLVARLLLVAVFALAARGTELWEKSKKAAQATQAPSSMQDRKTAIEVVDASLKEPRARLKAFNALSEVCCGIGIGLVISFHWGNVLDLTVGLALLALGFVLTMVSVRVFLFEFFGPAMVKAQLQGRPKPMPWVAE